METMKRPCNDCPFRKASLPGWLADYTPAQLHGMVMSEQAFPCHLTHHEYLESEEAENYPLCAGALKYMKKAGKIPRRRDLADAVHRSGDVDNILSIPEFFEHHKDA